jgi:hypothetical protein
MGLGIREIPRLVLYVDPMRLCGRPGCNEPATATFTFNSGQRCVWIDHVGRTNASAGHLCHRHADSLAPPRGWELQDRRQLARVLEHPGDAAAAAPAPVDDGILDAETPLLARAFRGARAS